MQTIRPDQFPELIATIREITGLPLIDSCELVRLIAGSTCTADELALRRFLRHRNLDHSTETLSRISRAIDEAGENG